jgi:membrane fusion protein (multidrug efflux system)
MSLPAIKFSGRVVWRIAIFSFTAALFACDRAGEEAGAMGMMGGRGPVQVVAAPVVAEPFTDKFIALGNAQANEAVDIIARVSSVVTGIHFTEGQRVERGALLVELDDAEIVADLASARAQRDKVRSQYERSKSLGKNQVVSEAELDELAADVRGAEADMRAAEARLDRYSIRAPITGVIGLRHVSPGDLVGADTVITTLDDTDIIKLNFSMPESYLANVTAGMQVAAATSAYPGRAFSGEVVSIDSRVDPVTRSITVVAVIENRDGKLKPGMFMTAELQRSRNNVLLIPEQALAPRSGRQFVFVVEDDVVAEREITLGVRQPGRVEVTSGLTVGALVVVEGVQKVRPGAQVIVTPAEGS